MQNKDYPLQQIAENLRRIRADRGWSLDQAARESGVSKAMLGQIERQESSPTIATMWKIANGFRVSLSSLIDILPDGTGTATTLLRDADSLRGPIAGDDMLVASLFPYDPLVSFEYFELTFPAGYNRMSDPHNSGVIEYVTVLSGAMDILSEGVWRHVGQGQSLRFAADQPHGYRNSTQIPAVAINLIHYPRPVRPSSGGPQTGE
jgi:transcriptional regulator with XRE-family HTH domain